MSTIEAGLRAPDKLWRDEIRAMLALSWPMVLTNLAQTAMTATDVMIIGRLGPDTLAAGSLGINLYFAPLILGLGLIYATAPMMATELGRRRHSVRDIRRTVRQGLWVSILAVIPIWILLWNGEAILLAMHQEPGLAREAGIYLRWLQWAILPFYGYIVLRSFISALERPGWALIIMFGAVAFNALANWCLVFGNFGFPAMGIAGSGLATTLSSALMFLGLAIVVSVERRFRRYHLFGRFWRADWPRFMALLRLGAPIAGILAFEVSIFNAAAFLMGLINAASLAAHAIAIQIASMTFMVPLGLNQAVTVRVGLAYGAGNPEGISRAGWAAYRDRRRFHGADGARDASLAAPADQRIHRSRRSRQQRGHRIGDYLPLLCGAVPDFRRRSGGCVGHAARTARYEGTNDIGGYRLLGRGLAPRRAACVPLWLRGKRHLDGSLRRPGRRSGPAAAAVAASRRTRLDCRPGMTCSSQAKKGRSHVSAEPISCEALVKE